MRVAICLALLTVVLVSGCAVPRCGVQECHGMELTCGPEAENPGCGGDFTLPQELGGDGLGHWARRAWRNEGIGHMPAAKIFAADPDGGNQKKQRCDGQPPHSAAQNDRPTRGSSDR